MKGFVLLLIVFISFCMASLGYGYKASEEVLYANQKMRYLSETLSLKHKMPEKDTVMMVPSLISNKALIFRYNEKKELSHLGISLFSDETKEMLDKKICDFLERILLELLLQKNKDGVCFKLNEYHIKMWINGQDYEKNNLWTLTNILNEMQMPVSFGLRHQEGRANAIWSFGVHKLQLDFPLYRDLIEGTDKKESDYELYNQLQGAAFLKVNLEDEKVDECSLVKNMDGIYVLPGEQYRIKALSSDRYYLKQGNEFKPVFHIDYRHYT